MHIISQNDDKVASQKIMKKKSKTVYDNMPDINKNADTSFVG